MPFAYRRPLLAIFVILIVSLCTTPVLANMGVPYWGGQLVAEPTGLEAVAIVRETLTIDLRGLADSEPAQVEAIYQIDNQGAVRTVNLLFATGATTVTDFQVFLNDVAVPSQVVTETQLPSSWQPPDQTPGLAGVEPLPYPGDDLVTEAALLSFAPHLLTGPQTLTVRYLAAATTNLSAFQPTRFWQFSYILAPARTWASFGGLDLTVLLPPEWLAATTPSLARTDDRLTASFATLPADALAITLRAPAGALYWALYYGGWALFGVALIGGGVSCWRVGRNRGRAQRRSWLIGLGLGLLWGVAVLSGGLLAILAPPAVIPADQSGAYGYGAVFGVFGIGFLSLLLILLGCLLTVGSAALARRKVSAAAG